MSYLNSLNGKLKTLRADVIYISNYSVLPAVVVIATIGTVAIAQDNVAGSYQPIQSVWGQFPQGRIWGSTSAVYPARDGSGNIWVAERCGQNSCVGKDDVDPILLFTASGRLLKSFGSGMIVWPHGIHVDAENNVWVTDARGAGGRGHQVLKFSPDGEVLMKLGKAGFAGNSPDSFNQPSDVLVAPNGDIFVADGHGPDGNNRIVKFSNDGRYIKSFGESGTDPGQFSEPHALAMDSRGRLFVGDRNNQRIQIFDQDGRFIAHWTQFGRPSGIFIDKNDIIYVADSESNRKINPGYKRGIRIGSVKDGRVTAFIPGKISETESGEASGAEGVAVDLMGNVYGAEVGSKTLKKYIK